MVLMRQPLLVVLTVVAITPFRTDAQQLRALSADSGRSEATVICGTDVPRPRTLPSAGSSPVIYMIAPCFQDQGGRSSVEPVDYLKDIHLRPSQPSDNRWVSFDAAAERQIFDDFQRLWSNHALDRLSIEIRDYRFSNGVIGKLVTYHIKER